MTTSQFNHGMVLAIAAVGDMDGLAASLNVSREAVRRWRNGVDQVPAERCVQIERVTAGQVRCEQLRPDVDWAVLRKPVPAAA